MNKKLLAEFKNPGSDYRGAPFWAWNGKLEPEELRWQIRVMKKMGLGGFFMHSRVGLDTAYLSDDWFKCVDACLDEAKKQDMNAWLYDEDRWPSGAAGGLVTKNPEYRQRGLLAEVACDPKKLKWTADTLAMFNAKVDGCEVSDVKRLKKNSKTRKLAKGRKLIRFSVAVAQSDSWYNGQTYLDTMNHEAVREFIKVTHEAYRKKCGKEFGKRIPGIFTDEPNRQFARYTDLKASTIAWTDAIPKLFKKRYGYDLIPHLPEIFFDVDGKEFSKVRVDYHDCITFLFVDAFSRQIGEWCDKNGLEHTGHVLEEPTLSSQTRVVGSAMRFYEYMQAPGMDILTEHNREYDTAKQVSSMANQFGRKWRLTETYGCTGWDFNFEGHKAIGDWQVALGINLRCQHLSWYTMKGEAKRDYPAGIFYQSPWWDSYTKVEDYFARIHSVMTRGKEIHDVLVIHPIESMWGLFREDWEGRPEVKTLDEQFVAVRDSLLKANISFDYGDEDILARHGKAGGTLRVAKSKYNTVVVPPMLTMRRSTLDLLKKFKKSGGTVVFVGDLPCRVDAVPSDDAILFAAECRCVSEKGTALAKAVESGRRVSITDARGKEIPNTLYLLKEDKDSFYLFICNNSLSASQWQPGSYEPLVRDRKVAWDDVRVKLLTDADGVPLELDPNTGETLAAKTSRGVILTSLPRIGSRLFVFPKKKSGKKSPSRPKVRTLSRRSLGGAGWDACLSEDNVLVFDKPRYKCAGGKWKPSLEILRLDEEVRRELGIPARGGRMVQPWAREEKKHPKAVDVELKYQFTAKALPSGNLYLALECPETFDISVNGVALNMEAECGWWCDKALRRIPVDPSTIRIGKNEISCRCRYDETHPGLELIYLLGQFGAAVRGQDVFMTNVPDELKIGDWCKQGLAFYAGNVTYEKSIKPKLKKNERVVVSVPEYRGVAVRVLVDGKPAGTTAWAPNEVDITDLLTGESQRLGIQVLGHRRNSHGPHHCAEKWPRWTGPRTYRNDWGWQDDYQLVPCGLMKEPELLVKRMNG